MQKIMPLLAVAAGLYSALGIWFPRMRLKWKGTQVSSGILGCVGFALFFISIGAIFLVADSIPERQRIWIILPPMFGWILVALGYALDMRTNSRRTSTLFPVLSQPQPDSRREEQGWLLFGIGIVFLVIVLCFFIFHS
jgi:surface polysaccharide O-acyltransferase-like enzyme